MKSIFKKYEKLVSIIVSFLVIVIMTFVIKYYFKPFISMILIALISNPLYKIMIKNRIPDKIAGAFSIVVINILIILIVLYLGSEIFNIAKNLYLTNLELVNKFLQDIARTLNLDINNIRIGKNVFSIINDQNIRRGAITTGEGIMAYFIGNISAYFILVDRRKIVELISMLLPKDTIIKFRRQKSNLTQMIGIEIILILLSMLETTVGFLILKIPNAFMLGIVCGLLDILPYVGTIIVFIPIIIYNIIMKNYICAFGLICLYVIVQIIREVLEAKFLSDKLDIHPLVVLLSIYVGVKIFGILGILVGPMYSILAKEIIYSTT